MFQKNDVLVSNLIALALGANVNLSQPATGSRVVPMFDAPSYLTYLSENYVLRYFADVPDCLSPVRVSMKCVCCLI